MVNTDLIEQTRRRKRELRAEFEARVEALDPQRRAEAGAEVLARALELDELRRASGVMVCLSFGAELETRPLIRALCEAGKTVYVPRSDRHDHQMHLHPWPCELKTLKLGLEQPRRSCPQLPDEAVADEVQAAVMLALAFDERGFRLGRGSGYVDRFFARHRIPGVGLCYDAQLVPELPVEQHDIPMAAVVSEARCLRPTVDSAAALHAWLSRDHEEIGDLLEGVLASEPFDAQRYARFRERLLRHIGVEERLLFPAALRARPDAPLAELQHLRIDHAALTSLLVPSPDHALAREIAGLLATHNQLEEGPEGIYARCLARLDDDTAAELLHGARARKPVPTTKYFDGPGTLRTAEAALDKARRARAC